MCRNEAAKACARADDMKAAGASRIVALLKEDNDTEVAAFRETYWSEEVLLDEQKRFYIALGGGQEYKPYNGVAAFLAMLANPFSKSRTKASMSAAKANGIDGNRIGEGFVAGGIYVVRQDGQAAYAFLEEDIGDHAPVEDVIEAVKAAVKGEVYLAAPTTMAEGGAADDKVTWKEWAGRTSGPDGYQIGDITRGIAAAAKRRSPCSRQAQTEIAQQSLAACGNAESTR